MQISSACFQNKEISNYIDNNGHFGICDITKQKGTTIDLQCLSEFLIAVASLLYRESPNGIPLYEAMQRDWSLFAENVDYKDIVNAALASKKNGITKTSKVALVDDVLGEKDWESLKDGIKYKYRFFFDSLECNLDKYINSANDTIKEGAILYRARINQNGVEQYEPSDMGCPERNLCTAGRANPQGISYLYLAEDADTTLYEVRSTLLDSVTVGSFKTLKPINIFDFSNITGLFETYNDSVGKDMTEKIRRKRFLDSVRADMSKPLTRYDSTLEYVPTQFICEYCRLNGIDGIRFQSAMHKTGMNIVLFNPSDVECVGVDVFKINDVILNSDIIKNDKK